MCVVAFAWNLHPRWRLLLGGNRDEFHARATAPLAHWGDGSGIIAGRDLEAGGTWLGVDGRGRCALVTNVRDLRLGQDGRYRWHWDPSWMHSPRGDPRFLLDMMDEADWTDRVPTLLVRGMKSDMVDDDGVDDLRRRIPHLEIADIRGAGHMVAGDKNDEFNAAVIEFLTRVMPPKG